MLLSITHIDILFKIPTNKLITRNYNTFCNLYLYKTNMIEPFNLVKATKIQILINNMMHKMVNFCQMKNWYLSFTFSTIRFMAFINSKKLRITN